MILMEAAIFHFYKDNRPIALLQQCLDISCRGNNGGTIRIPFVQVWRRSYIFERFMSHYGDIGFGDPFSS